MQLLFLVQSLDNPDWYSGLDDNNLSLIWGVWSRKTTSEIKLGLKVVTGRNYEPSRINLLYSLTIWYVWRKHLSPKWTFGLSQLNGMFHSRQVGLNEIRFIFDTVHDLIRFSGRLGLSVYGYLHSWACCRCKAYDILVRSLGVTVQ